MICPACNSANPDDVTFCLHCGQYQGEHDETTRVFPPRVPPQTTIAASYRPPSTFDNYLSQRERRWPYWVAFISLTLVGLVGIGLIAAVVVHDRGGVTVDLPDNNRLTAFAKESPTAVPTTNLMPRVERPAATPSATSKVIDQGVPLYEATPTPKPQNVMVVNWSGWLKDGAAISWQLPEGVYGIDFTASGDGGTVEVVGSDCFKTPPMRTYRQRCQVSYPGQLVVTNPTVFALGPAISASVKVTRLIN